MNSTLPLSGNGNCIYYDLTKEAIRVIWGASIFKLPQDGLTDIMREFFHDNDSWYKLGAKMDGPPPGSLGEYLNHKYPSLTPRHASAIAAIMVNEGLLQHRGSKPIELKRCK